MQRRSSAVCTLLPLCAQFFENYMIFSILKSTVFHFKKHSSALTYAGGGLAWTACHFQVEENSTHLRPWEANAKLLSSSAGWEHGRRGEEKGDKAEELESSILPLTQTGKSVWFFHLSRVFALLPLLPHVGNSSLVEWVHPCCPASGTKQSPTLRWVSVVLAHGLCAVQGWASSTGCMDFLSVSVKPA